MAFVDGAARAVNDILLGPLGSRLIRNSSLKRLYADNDELRRQVDAASLEARAHREAYAPRDALGSWVLAELEGGQRLWVDLGDYGVSRHCLAGAYEPVESGFVRSTLKPGQSFIDVGANIGWFTILGARAVGPMGHVYAVEPRPPTCERLRMSVAENGYRHVNVLQAALGAAPGRMAVASLLAGRNPGATWLVATDALNAQFRAGYERFDVDVIRLDDVAPDRCDLLKIDVEGAEYLALCGATETIRRCRPIIVSEINAEPLKQVSGVSPDEYVQFVEGLGYRTHAVSERGSSQILPAGFASAITSLANVAFVPV